MVCCDAALRSIRGSLQAPPFRHLRDFHAMRTRISVLASLIVTIPNHLLADEPPRVGDKAPDFILMTRDDQTARPSELTFQGNVVLVVLRGWPGYQCPTCDRQV